VTAAASSGIKLITFDLGNVLVHVDHQEFCRRLAGLAGVTAAEVFNYVFASDLEPAYDTGSITSQEFYRRIVARFKVSLDFDQFALWWNSIFCPMPDMAEVVARLARSCPLFLLSNTNELHFDYIRERYPILDHFSRFVLSYRVGSRKPETGIYRNLIQTSGLLPDHILFIDDKLPFVTAAREHGIHAWQFTSPQELQERLTEHGLW